MAKNKSFVLRLDEDMMNAIEAWAADEFRSTNGQIQYILNEALKKSGRLKKASPRPSPKGEGVKKREEGLENRD